ncbi:apolipoprotein A-I-like [Danio aesculapii]|uniref:apolipoprotein A-I-like n=1 Tax=Danio aesculapii TaxID=1142201 RepID=UPI0024BFD332|nr:apolipoprotein A-I-like [Danio aesculapii]
MMKIPLVIALAMCTGCQANFFNADEPKPQLKLADVFRSFVDQTRRTAEETIEKIQTSQVGQEFKQHTTNLKETMDPLMTQITEGADMLKNRIEEEMSVVRCALKPYIEVVTDPFEKAANHMREALKFEAREVKS